MADKVAKPRKYAKKRTMPGPKPEALKLEGDWKENICKSMQAAKPAEG